MEQLERLQRPAAANGIFLIVSMFGTEVPTHFKVIHAAISHSTPLSASSELSVLIADKDQKFFVLNADFLATIDTFLKRQVEQDSDSMIRPSRLQL